MDADLHDGGNPTDADLHDGGNPTDADLHDGGTLPSCIPNECASSWVVEADGAQWIEEGDELRFEPCSTTPACSTAQLRMEPLPDGASFDPESGVLSWTPRLDQAALWHLELVSSETDERVPLTIGVADRFDAPGNTPPIDIEGYTSEFGLPVIHVRWHSDDPNYCRDDVRRDAVPADIMIGGHLYEQAEMRCRGATSLAFPKKSFTLRFASADPFMGEGKLARFDGRRRLILTQTFDDSSQIRTRLAFELWNMLDPEHIRIEQSTAIVYVDGEYQGLYQVTDDVGDHLLAAQGLNKDGNLFKSESHSGDLRATRNGSPKLPIWAGYEKAEGEPEDDFTDLVELLEWVSYTTDEDFASQIDSRLRTEDFVHWYVFSTVIIADDSYGKNSHLYHDPSDPTSRWRFVPWDMNASFGQNWASWRVPPTTEPPFSGGPFRANGVWERMANIDSLRMRLEERYFEALRNEMNVDAVIALIDEMTAEIAPSARRDDRKWHEMRRSYPLWAARTDLNEFDAEIAYVRNWTLERWAFVAGAE